MQGPTAQTGLTGHRVVRRQLKALNGDNWPECIGCGELVKFLGPNTLKSPKYAHFTPFQIVVNDYGGPKGRKWRGTYHAHECCWTDELTAKFGEPILGLEKHGLAAGRS